MQSAQKRQGEVKEKCARRALISHLYFQIDVIFGKTSICKMDPRKSFDGSRVARGSDASVLKQASWSSGLQRRL